MADFIFRILCLSIKLLYIYNDTDAGVNSGDNTGKSDPEETFPCMCLPYMGIKGENILKSFKNRVKKVLPNQVILRVTFKG